MGRATGTFHVTSWDEKTYEELEGGAKLTRARVAQDFAGDLQASGTWEFLMCYRPDGTAEFTGLARLVGKIGARSGSLVIRANGVYDGKEAKSTWAVVRGSATGELFGLRGSGSAAAPHGPDGRYVLDYEI